MSLESLKNTWKENQPTGSGMSNLDDKTMKAIIRSRTKKTGDCTHAIFLGSFCSSDNIICNPNAYYHSFLVFNEYSSSGFIRLLIIFAIYVYVNVQV